MSNVFKLCLIGIIVLMLVMCVVCAIPEDRDTNVAVCMHNTNLARDHGKQWAFDVGSVSEYCNSKYP